MAQFSEKKIDTTTINGGQQVVNGSGVTPELFNAPVESALYTEKAIEVLTSNVDVSQANAVGTPTVSFSSKTEGGVEYKYLKFANLKGETGKTGRTGPEGPEGKIGPVGPKGDTGEAAGFGTPTISVETLEEGSTATASVRATGDDTAKVFSFNFGLPKGDTGRGIATVVSDGNDLIIKYDDGEEVRLRGVIQTINALVADSKADFEAAQIEENIGKTISYKGDLYLILGKNRTKLVNNGVTDYNALYNTPVYIATSEESFNEYLQSYNVNKIISYNGDLYTVVETKNAPIAVGDTIDKLYFNTSVEPDFSQLPFVDSGPDTGLILITGSSGLQIHAWDSGQGYYELYIGDVTLYGKNGWTTDATDRDGVYYFSIDVTVYSVNQQELWSSYISKEPFESEEESAPEIIAKKIGGESGGNIEEIENEVEALSKEITGLNSSVEEINERVAELENAEISYPKAHRFNTVCDNWAESGNNVYPYRAKVCSYDSSLCYLITPHTASSAKTCEDIGVCFADGDSGYVWVYTKTQPENVYTHIMFTITSFECDSVSTNGEVYFSLPAEKSQSLPVVTPEDAGKFLRVDSNGNIVAQSIPYAEEASF